MNNFTYHRSVIVTFFLSNIFRACLKLFLQVARDIFFGAREIFFVSPFRKKIVTSFSSRFHSDIARGSTSFATIRSQFFSLQLSSARSRSTSVGLGREANHEEIVRSAR